MAIIHISDLSDPQLEAYASLTHAQLRNRLEPEKGIFIAESVKVIRTALEAGYTPLSLLMESKRIQGGAAGLLELCGEDVPVYTAPREVLASLTGYPLSRGVLCAMRRPRLPSVEEVCRGKRRVAVLEGLTDAVNVGSLFRSAAALGIDGILVTSTCCDPLYRRAVRVSMGTVFQVPWTCLDPAPDFWPSRGLSLLRSLGFTTAALALREDALPLDHPALSSIPALALILGTEGDGLCSRTIAESDLTIRIPMSHGVDSLNVSAAGAVAFWQLRARREAP